MIGIFDSGLGGVSILKGIHRVLPQQDFLYFADQAYLPYGAKSNHWLIQRSHQITQWLVSQGADLIVVACNTATTSAITSLRQSYNLPFIGVEPAIKPASQTNLPIIILATDSTLHSHRLKHLTQQYASNCLVIKKSCPKWLDLVESGSISGLATTKQIHSDLYFINQPSAIVLACTHYLFFSSTIQAHLPQSVVFDPTSAIANQVVKQTQPHLTKTSTPALTLVTTAFHQHLESIAFRLLGQQVQVESVTI